MRVLVTGADGFLGWHLRCHLHAFTDHVVVPVGSTDWHGLSDAMVGVDAVVHLAGINRGDDSDLVHGNLALAQDLAKAIRSVEGASPVVVYANSIQAGNGSAYGTGKAAAAAELRELTAGCGSRVVDVRLPNLFGEHGRPRYNSFVATFVDATIHGAQPSIEDRPIELMHAQDAAQALVTALDGTAELVEPQATPTSVGEVWRALQRFHQHYVPAGELPRLDSQLELDLFNTYRAALFTSGAPTTLAPRADARGRLVETVRTHGSGGQTFVSTTRPGVTRGDHYHVKKIERFVVLDGHAVIRLRRLFDDEVVEFAVSGEVPVAIDMPTMWVHNITNVGDTTLTTLFWTNTLFDPEMPDTVPTHVAIPAQEGQR